MDAANEYANNRLNYILEDGLDAAGDVLDFSRATLWVEMAKAFEAGFVAATKRESASYYDPISNPNL